MAGGAAPRLQVQHGDAEEEAGSLLHAEDHGLRHNDEVETHRASILGLYEARVRYDIKYVKLHYLHNKFLSKKDPRSSFFSLEFVCSILQDCRRTAQSQKWPAS